MRRKFLTFAAFILLVGCATGERTLPAVLPDSPVPQGMARVSVTRSGDLLYLALAANVTVNDQRAGSLYRGQSTAAEVPAGVTTVTATGFGAPGRFVLRFPTVSGGRYDLLAAPRGDSLGPALAFGLIGSMLDAAANPEQGGAFNLTIVSASPPVGTPPPTPPPLPIAATAGDRDERLAELRRLWERGLITNDVYRDEQRRVLAPVTSTPAR